jgi:hypothetical protein
MPRILAILFAAFLSVFALDVFGEGYWFWGTIRALFMHLIPTMIVLAALIIAWRWEGVGGHPDPCIGGMVSGYHLEPPRMVRAHFRSAVFDRRPIRN